MYQKWVTFLNNESGATAIEYAMIASMISATVIGASFLLGSTISVWFNTLANSSFWPG